MGELSEFGLATRAFLKAYPWRRVDPVPWTVPPPLRGRPLGQCRLALVSSAGLRPPDAEPFDASVKGGDCSFREVPAELPAAALVDDHRSKSFDHAGVRADPNLGLPLDRARELVQRGRVGSLATHHLAFMGSVTAPGRLVKETAPAAAARLVADAVDIALLVPV
jgi:D-proline reductase (dithiol) PrdB